MPTPQFRKGFDSENEYQRVHKLIRSKRGSASNYECVDCSSNAKDWSHVHGSDHFDLDSYVPRCKSCHFKYDDLAPKGKSDTWPISMSLREIEEVIARRALNSN